MSEPHNPYSVFKIRDYKLFMAGSMCSVIGFQIMNLALGWELYNRPHDTSSGAFLALGYIGLARAVPMLAFMLPAGHVADRFDRRRVTLISQIVVVLSSVGLGLLSFYHGDVVWMYACVVLRSVAGTFGRPAKASMLPQILPATVFSTGVAWSTTIFQLALVIGPALGGLIIAPQSLSLTNRLFAAYLADIAFSVIAFLLTAMLTPQKKAQPHEPTTLKTLVAGVHFVWHTKIILAALTLDLFAVLFGGAEYLMPAFARDILHVGETGLGWLRAAPAVGALAMALMLAHRPPLKHAGCALLWAVAGFGTATIVLGLSHTFWLSIVMLVLTGAFDNISVVIRHTLVQLRAPDAMRGRVSAVNNMFIDASNELGGLESGMTAAWFGPVISVVGGGIGTICVVIGAALTWPQIRRIGALHEIKPEEVVGRT